MPKIISLYLDVCCLNRPFDDWRQARIRLEAEVILEILNRCQTTDWQLISSFALVAEIKRTPNLNRRQQVLAALDIAARTIEMTPAIVSRAQELVQRGIKGFDALHLACAEQGQVDILLTTDDRLLRQAASIALTVPIANPLTWFINAEQANGEDL
ncbi:MAG: PIN domain-containing protein [Elainellaceae cyanobacterium]